MGKTSIAWTNDRWNPVTGRSKVSAGCKHCYAEVGANRFWATQYPRVSERVSMIDAAGYPAVETMTRPRVFTDVQCHEDRLDQPLRWKKPRKLSVNSMSDLFHEDVPDAFIDRVFAVMAWSSWHTFQILTKRAERMKDYRPSCSCGGVQPPTCVGVYEHPEDPPSFGCDDCCGHGNEDGCCKTVSFPLPNVWLGVSVENRAWKSRVIPHLVSTPAAVRFVSVEPLLEDLGDISDWFPREREVSQTQSVWINGVNWIIVGGESGPKSRPLDVAWARSIVKQCQAAGLPVFVKQLGANPTTAQTGYQGYNGRRLPDRMSLSLRDAKGGDPHEWPADLRVREFPEARP